MGVDFSATAVIGMEIARDELYEVRDQVVRCCPDEHPDSFEFCPQNGYPVRRTERRKEPVADYDEEEGLLAGFKVVRGAYDRQLVVVAKLGGVNLCKSSDEDRYGDAHGFLPWPDAGNLDKAREGLAAALEPLGLWRPERFGLHAFLNAD